VLKIDFRLCICYILDIIGTVKRSKQEDRYETECRSTAEKIIAAVEGGAKSLTGVSKALGSRIGQRPVAKKIRELVPDIKARLQANEGAQTVKAETTVTTETIRPKSAKGRRRRSRAAQEQESGERFHQGPKHVEAILTGPEAHTPSASMRSRAWASRSR